MGRQRRERSEECRESDVEELLDEFASDRYCGVVSVSSTHGHEATWSSADVMQAGGMMI